MIPARPLLQIHSTLLLLAGLLSSIAAATPASAQVSVERFLSGVVEIRSVIDPAADSIDYLGAERHGSGAVISADGLIVTVAYLVLHAQSIELTLASGAQLSAEVAALDTASGLALLRAALPADTRPLTPGSSQTVSVGQRHVALDYRGPEFATAVEVIDTSPFAAAHEYYLERALITAPQRAQFSGALLIDRQSRLLGVGAYGLADVFDSASADPSAAVAGNLFVPIDALTQVLGELLLNGVTQDAGRPWLGLHLSSDLRVSRVHADGPAALAGILVGDQLIAFDGRRIDDRGQLYQRLWRSIMPGQRVEIALFRGEQLLETTVKARHALEQTLPVLPAVKE